MEVTDKVWKGRLHVESRMEDPGFTFNRNGSLLFHD